MLSLFVPKKKVTCETNFFTVSPAMKSKIIFRNVWRNRPSRCFVFRGRCLELLLSDWFSTQLQTQRERNAVRVSAAVSGASVAWDPKDSSFWRSRDVYFSFLLFAFLARHITCCTQGKSSRKTWSYARPLHSRPTYKNNLLTWRFIVRFCSYQCYARGGRGTTG